MHYTSQGVLLVFVFMYLLASVDNCHSYDIDCGAFIETECNSAGDLIAEANVKNKRLRLFYFNNSDTVVECIGDSESSTHLLQICSLRSLFAQCSDGGTTSVIVLDDCRGWRCLGKETQEVTRCVMELVGIRHVPNKVDEGWRCGIPPMNGDLFQWGPPIWEWQSEIRERSHCLTNLPTDVRFDRRFAWEDLLPRIQYRIVFPDRAFLRAHRGSTCLIKQHCDGVASYQATSVCFDVIS